VENSQDEFSTLPSALANPAPNAGFPHSHSDDGGGGPPNCAGDEKPKPDRSLAIKTGHLDKLRTGNSFCLFLARGMSREFTRLSGIPMQKASGRQTSLEGKGGSRDTREMHGSGR